MDGLNSALLLNRMVLAYCVSFFFSSKIFKIKLLKEKDFFFLFNKTVCLRRFFCHRIYNLSLFTFIVIDIASLLALVIIIMLLIPRKYDDFDVNHVILGTTDGFKDNTKYIYYYF